MPVPVPQAVTPDESDVRVRVACLNACDSDVACGCRHADFTLVGCYSGTSLRVRLGVSDDRPGAGGGPGKIIEREPPAGEGDPEDSSWRACGEGPGACESTSASLARKALIIAVCT